MASGHRDAISLPQQIRAILACALDCLFSAPPCNLCVISGKQNVWNFPIAKLCRPRVLRRFKESAAETIVRRGLLVAERAGEQTYDRIRQHDRSNGTVCKHIIPNGNFKIDKVFNHAVIDAFVMTTNDDEMRFLRKLCRQLLVEPTPSR